jgi:formylglycine-generating enzyme required for sulfatase activity
VKRQAYLQQFPEHAAVLEELRPQWICPACKRIGLALEDETAIVATCPRCHRTHLVSSLFLPAQPSETALAKAAAEARAQEASARLKARRRTRWQLGGVAAVLGLALLAVWYLASHKDHGERPQPKPAPPGVDRQPPEGWLPVKNAAGEPEIITVKADHDRRYYRRLVREVDGERVELVLVDRRNPDDPNDPDTFYIMENKVWNKLFSAFTEKERLESNRLFSEYTIRRGYPRLVNRLWQRPRPTAIGSALGQGGGLPNLWQAGWTVEALFLQQHKEHEALLLGPGTEKWPALGATVTEAYCIATWLGGKLPTRKQWLKAAGVLDNTERKGPFGGPPNWAGMALNSDMPWPVDKGNRDLSIFGCRQMASNGLEWTCSEYSEKPRENIIPVLAQSLLPPSVYLMGQSYQEGIPRAFADMLDPARAKSQSVQAASLEVGFRIVLECK